MDEEDCPACKYGTCGVCGGGLGTAGNPKDAEIERLRGALRIANGHSEHFERGWYLRGDALEWYRDEARALATNMAGGAHTAGVLASVTVLSLDAGQRADAALMPNVGAKRPDTAEKE